MRSDVIKKGIERAGQRALLHACGVSRDDMKKPFIGIINSYNEIVPGHMHLDIIAKAVKEGIRAAGGVPFEMGTIAICDGITMNHAGMKYSFTKPGIDCRFCRSGGGGACFRRAGFHPEL